MTVLILHGTWVPDANDPLGGRFFVWAERVPGGRRGRRPAAGPKEGAPHPFQARPEEVRDAAVALSPALARQADRSTWRLVRQRLRLPSRDGSPLHSPEAARAVAAAGGEDAAKPLPGSHPRLATWQIRGVALEPVRAVQLLASLPVDGRAGFPNVLLGTDLRFWSAAAKLGLELLARQRFTPVLERGWGEATPALDAGLEARWRPVLDDPRDAERLERLARSHPPAIRALVRSDGRDPDQSGRSLLEGFLDTAVDGLARAWLATESARRGAPVQAANPSRAWLEALRRGERAVRAGSLELEQLSRRLAQWRAPLVTAASGSSYRTCFRLEPPDGGRTTDPSFGASGPGSGPAGRRAEAGAGNAGNGEPGTDTWTLRIFLQATDDPSLLAPAEEVWRESGNALVYLNRRFDLPQERLLADLGRAARSFPALERCLTEPQPTQCSLTAEEAYGFLREAAWLLEENGFGVVVPAWWDRRGPRGRLGLRLRLRPADSRGGQATQSSTGRARHASPLGGQSIVEYDWRLAVGDPAAGSGQAVELSEEEFRQLAALRVPLVWVRGQWVELRPDKIEQAISFWQKRAHAAAGAADAPALPTDEALSLALGAEEVDGLPILEVDSEGWVTELLGRLDGRASGATLAAALATPPGFFGQLRPYQERGVGWLTFLSDCGLGACLADDMGLGKTIQYIAYLLHRRARSANGGAKHASPLPPGAEAPITNPGPALLLCPTSVVGNWRHELERFAPELRALVHHGPSRLAGTPFAAEAQKQDLVISSYALVHRDRDTLASVNWDGVVLDEAQNVKNPGTLQARAVRSLRARYRFALTGTPIENRLSELWSIVDFLNPGYLGTQHGFRQRFIVPIERWQDQERADQLRRLVQPLLLRRVKTDPTIIRDLPDKLEMKVFCTLTAEQASLYQAVVSDMLARIEASDGMQRRGLVLATLTRLKQVCNHPAHLLADGSALSGRSGKLDRLQEMLEEVLAEGDRALVFTQFAEFGARLREHLQNVFGQEVSFLHGGVPAEQRDALVERFQSTSGGPIFVLSLRAGGVGLNLTGASHVFHFDRWWNPAVEDQATDRAFRIGQRRNVQVHKFICSGTLEEKIDALIEGKKALAEQVIGTGEGWLTELSTAELRDLLTLRAGAVVE